MPTFGSGDTFVNLHRDPGAPMTTFAEVEHNSPFSNETDDERRSRLRTVVAASLLGTTVEWYDFFLYATAASLVFNQLFFPNQSSFVGTMLSFATFAVGFLVRPIGGVVFGHIGDRIGRKKTLALTMFIMGIATALMGVLPTAAQIGVVAPILLLLLRILQGFALGGEWAGAVLLAVEHSPEKKRGLFGSIPQIGLALGLALGTGMFALLQTAFDDEQFLRFGWRIAFVLSLVLVIVGLVVRLKVDERRHFRRFATSNDARPPRSGKSFKEESRETPYWACCLAGARAPRSTPGVSLQSPTQPRLCISKRFRYFLWSPWPQ